ncbi:MAG: type II toxin-antitoxin system VapC family toxin [Gammaproteobacteria bacterium]|nr:type II toxin-antitoxin system VapC family toxin [Gammaproteobacteria bacterium]
MILLDTNVLSELTRTLPEPKVVRWLEENDPLLALPSIALAELRYGIARLPTGRRRTSLLDFWSKTRQRFVGRIYSFDERAAEAYGDLAAAAEGIGRRLNVADGQIAAIAKVHRMTVATRDKNDFAASGVPVVNPWT